jgi:hypothetical protein
LSATSAAFDVAIKSKKMHGFIQNIERDKYFEISMYTEKQFECLNKTPYEDRILHIDATGGLVKVSNKFTDQHVNYKRILNYFFLVRNTNLEKPNNKFQLGIKLFFLLPYWSNKT